MNVRVRREETRGDEEAEEEDEEDGKDDACAHTIMSSWQSRRDRVSKGYSL
jgi:hypothetical protein